MGFKIKGATVATIVAAAGAAMAVKVIVTDEKVKENFNEAKEGFINSSKELMYATGAVLSDAVNTIKKEVKDITDEVKSELKKETESEVTEESGLDSGVTFDCDAESTDKMNETTDNVVEEEVKEDGQE